MPLIAMNRARIRKSHVISRMSVARCVDKVVSMVRSPEFEETEESRDKLRDVALENRPRTQDMRSHHSAL